MSLKAILTQDEHDEITVEEIKAEYTANGDMFVLQVTAVNGTELVNTEKLRSALSKEKRKAEESARALKKFDGIEDVDAALEAMKKLEELADFDPDEKLSEAKKQFEKQLQDQYASKSKQLTDQHSRVVEELTSTKDSLLSQLDSTLVDSQVESAILTKKGKLKWLKPVVKERIKTVLDDDGKLQVRIIGDDGTERLSTRQGNTEEFMSIPEFVHELSESEDFAGAFEGSGAHGSGAGGSDKGAGGGGSTTKLADMSPSEKLKRGHEIAAKR